MSLHLPAMHLPRSFPGHKSEMTRARERTIEQRSVPAHDLISTFRPPFLIHQTYLKDWGGRPILTTVNFDRESCCDREYVCNPAFVFVMSFAILLLGKRRRLPSPNAARGRIVRDGDFCTVTAATLTARSYAAVLVCWFSRELAAASG